MVPKKGAKNAQQRLVFSSSRLKSKDFTDDNLNRTSGCLEEAINPLQKI